MHRRFASLLFFVLFFGLSLLVDGTLFPLSVTHAASAPAVPAKANAPILPGPLAGSSASGNAVHAQVAVRPAPLTTRSLYESTTNAAKMYAQGCAAARGTTGIVILDFGQPLYLGKEVYGTFDFGGHSDSDAAILGAVENFVRGVGACHTAATNMALAIGESNYSSGNAMPHTTTAWYADGQQWGNLVNQAQSYVVSQHYQKIIGIYGSADLETEWSSFSLASSLVNGYNKATSRYFFDFGDDTPGYWTYEQVWYVAYGAHDDLPLPEIYYNANAASWQAVSNWACSYKGGPLVIKGVMSTSIGNSPAQSWAAMYRAEASNTCTARALSGLLFTSYIAF